MIKHRKINMKCGNLYIQEDSVRETFKSELLPQSGLDIRQYQPISGLRRCGNASEMMDTREGETEEVPPLLPL